MQTQALLSQPVSGPESKAPILPYGVGSAKGSFLQSGNGGQWGDGHIRVSLDVKSVVPWVEAIPHLMSWLQPTAWIPMEDSTAPLNARGPGSRWPGHRMSAGQTLGSQVPQMSKPCCRVLVHGCPLNFQHGPEPSRWGGLYGLCSLVLCPGYKGEAGR